MLADHVITRDELFAVGATFTLVAWAFAYTYTVCQAIEPGSFTAAVDPDGERTLDGAAVPELHDALEHRASATSSRSGRSRAALVMLEQLAGLAYVAMVVSRLVGLLVVRRAVAEDSPEEMSRDA